MSPDSQASWLPPQTMECHGEHPSSKIKSLHPAMPQGLLDAALNRLFKAIVILMLSVSSISTYNFFPGDATCNLPVSWPQLLTSFTPGDRSAQMRGTFTVTGQMVLLVSLLNASAKMAAGSFVAAGSYTNDGTALALESHLLPHFLSSHYTAITSTKTTFNTSQTICKRYLPYLNAYINITTPRHSSFHYKLLQQPCHQPPPYLEVKLFNQPLQHGIFPALTAWYNQPLQHGLITTPLLSPDSNLVARFFCLHVPFSVKHAIMY